MTSGICRIRVKYGPNKWTPVRGGGGGTFFSFGLKPGELIRAVYVSTTTYQVTTWSTAYTASVLCKITFLTDGKTFGPYGSCADDTEKCALFPNGIFYFSGSTTSYLNKLTFYSSCSNGDIIIPSRGVDY